MQDKKIVASIEARMTSNRLPGKVLMEAVNGISMLEYMIERVKKSRLIDDIVIATTINKEDDGIIDLCNKLNVKYYRGSEEDVLLRVLETHEFIGSELIVELTGDCPLIDPIVIDKVIDKYLNNNYDYVSNTHIRSYPDGFDVEVFSLKLLKQISKITNNSYDREHVSPYLYRSGKYTTSAIVAQPDEYWPELRVTLDDKGDYLLLKNIIEYFQSKHHTSYSVSDVVKYIKNNSTLLELNKDARFKAAPFQKLANNKNG